uniref:Carboxylic ester hydrolase n=1 Tax=Anopheles maculatus TaxID=74869 RepID=A0A182SHG7_9DIPT
MQPFLAAVLRLLVGLLQVWLNRAWLKLRPPAANTCTTVTIGPGKVRGLRRVTDDGTHYHLFKGIPYAVPPVGDLRFQAPVPLESFQKPVLECFVEGSKCLQYDQILNVLVGSEDGLFLNVYTPQLPDGNASGLPVMVYLHGGGFLSGSGDSFLYDPIYFMEQRVVIVTFNYRLGPLGFLSFPEAGIEGNAGLKDQLLVLQWIQQNIAPFGGDPNNVTLFGESAGAKAAYLHYLSPVSSGEGMVALVKAQKHLHSYNTHPERLLPPVLHLPPGVNVKELAQKVKRFYFQTRPISDATLPEMMDLLSDNEYITATVTAAELMAKYQPKVKHYCYYFTHDGRLGNIKRLLNMAHLPGVCHGDDVFYMFHSALNAALRDDAAETIVRKAFVRMWSNFAYEGDPTPNGGDRSKGLTQWDPVESCVGKDYFKLRCLQIDASLKMVSNPFLKRTKFWRDLFRTYGYSSRTLPE